MVRRGERVTVDVPLHVTGSPAGDGLTTTEFNTLSLEVEATAIPSAVQLSSAGAEPARRSRPARSSCRRVRRWSAPAPAPAPRADPPPRAGRARASGPGGSHDRIVAATHVVLSGPAVDRLKNSPITEVIVMNMLPIDPERVFPQLTVLSSAPDPATGDHRRAGRDLSSP